ncbi:MAG TPA: MarR family transcriptional regulator [Vicinamibacterales bacterium]|nr:MarR family transcriptional regulator [Vicinamibacterales bacterium]
MPRQKHAKKPVPLAPNTAFLLSQVGGHSAEVFANLLAPLDLASPHAGIIWMLNRSPGISQQDLADVLKVHPSRLVALLDELEHRRYIDRRGSESDRRLYALHLTPEGERMFGEIRSLADEHQRLICAPLTPAECDQLADLLRRIAVHRKLTPSVHPGYRWLGRKIRSSN